MEELKCNILLIEDDILDQMALKRFLSSEKYPYELQISNSISQTMEILKTKQFDVIVTDFSLGDGTALDILNVIKDIPIIITTGAGDEEVAVKAWKAGAYDYLSKDCNREYLKVLPKTIENVIKRKNIEDALDRKQRNLEAIFDAVPAGLLFADKNFIVTRANEAIKKVFQKDYSLIIGRPIGEALDCLNNIIGQKGCGNNPDCASCIIRKNIQP